MCIRDRYYTFVVKGNDNMKFIENVEKNRYEKFVKNHKKSHFLQSYLHHQDSYHNDWR